MSPWIKTSSVHRSLGCRTKLWWRPMKSWIYSSAEMLLRCPLVERRRKRFLARTGIQKEQAYTRKDQKSQISGESDSKYLQICYVNSDLSSKAVILTLLGCGRILSLSKRLLVPGLLKSTSWSDIPNIDSALVQLNNTSGSSNSILSYSTVSKRKFSKENFNPLGVLG